MADYNYTNLDFTFDLNIEKQNDFFKNLYSKTKEEAIEIIKQYSPDKSFEIEFYNISENKETNLGLLQLNISYKYVTPIYVIQRIYDEFKCDIQGSSTTYDSDYKKIYIKNNKLIIEEYYDNKAYIMKLLDDENEYYINKKDIKNYLIKFKNKKLINFALYGTLKTVYKNQTICLCSTIIEDKKHFLIIFDELNEEEMGWLKTKNITLEKFMIFDDSEMSTTNFLERNEVYFDACWICKE